jgi:integral membrane sensor domain MASE1
MRHLLIAAAVASTYYLGGKAGLLLAIPPGYATAVWPPSGLALVAVLLYGYRVWSGVLLGSMLLNAEITLAATGQSASIANLWPAASIASGAAMQAVVGALLIRRFVGFPSALDQSTEIVKFSLLGGPVGCLINATWGSLTLLGAGAMVPGSLPFNWFTWWVGDTIGVLIFTPLVLIWMGQPRRVWRQRRLPLALSLGVTFVLAVTVFVYTSAWEHARLKLEFERRAFGIAQNAQLNIKRYLDALYSIQGFYASVGEPDRGDFGTYVEQLYRRNDGIQALEWIPRVRDDQRSKFVASARRDGFPNFQINEKTAGGNMAQAARRQEYYPVYYVEPYAGNEQALGFDLA